LLDIPPLIPFSWLQLEIPSMSSQKLKQLHFQ
jgi:hypothetical protein